MVSAGKEKYCKEQGKVTDAEAIHRHTTKEAKVAKK
jgi:hypothetical protein